MVAASRPPLRRVWANDFELRVGEDVFFPHADEWADFLPYLSVGDYLLALESDDRPILATVAGEFPEVAGNLREMVDTLSSQVVAWNWTDGGGRLLPQPADGGLLRLSHSELRWMLGAALGSRGTSDDPNAGPPSTSPSTDEREGASRGNGGSPRSARNSTARPKKR